MSHLIVNGVDKTLDHIYVNTGSIVKEAWEARVRAILHGLSEPLCGISTYKDLLVLSTGDLTRYVKKLVLTGEETPTSPASITSTNAYQFRDDITDYAREAFICSHMPVTTSSSGSATHGYIGSYLTLCFDKEMGLDTTDKVKSYLAAQYAAGTPVTIWYVLTTPETEQITVPAHLTGTVEGYLTQTEPPTPTNPIYPTANGAEEQGGTYSIDTGEYALAWGRADTFTGTNSISARCYGLPVKSWSIFGNSQQTGTPAPDAPIMPEFVGERTAQLFDISTVEKGRIDNGVVGYASATTDLSVTGNKIEFTTNANFRGVCGGFIEIPSGAESISFYGQFRSDAGVGKKVVFYDAQKTWLNADVIFGITDNGGTATIPNGAKFVRMSFTAQVAGTISISNLMFNAGVTALPYEPFGYKIPLTSAGQAQNVYLGQVQTVRKIRKYEFTGNEQWSLNTDTGVLYTFTISDFLKASGITCICSHYPPQENASGVAFVREKHVCFRTSTYNQFYLKDADFDSTDAIKAFLQQQYAAGTPVCVWYVLTTEQTGIVNEPLCKIGAYADELSSENTNTTLNTNDGTTTITVDTTLQPSEFVINVHAKAITP